MSVVSNRQFLLYTIGLLVVWLIVLVTAISSSNLVPAVKETIEDEKWNIRNCKALCDQCSCLDFYCGEECICECNNENSDTECIARMQSHARRLRMPFEILIQGPSANSFVRNAIQFEQKNMPKKIWHSKRSTVTIYKPDSNGSLTTKTKLPNRLLSNVISNNLDEKLIAERSKRSTSTAENASNTNQFEWFNDLPNNLVRPAPLGVRSRNSEEPKTTVDVPKTTKSHSVLEKPWFMDNTAEVLTPAPLSKRQGYAAYSRERGNDDEVADVTHTDVETTSKSSTSIFPWQPKEGGLRALSKDIANALGVNLMNKQATDGFDNKQLWNKNIDNAFVEVPNIENSDEDLDSKLEETLRDLNGQRAKVKVLKPVRDMRKKDVALNEDAPLVPKPAMDMRKEDGIFKNQASPDFRIPWWRPVRFFQRVVFNQ